MVLFEEQKSSYIGAKARKDYRDGSVLRSDCLDDPAIWMGADDDIVAPHHASRLRGRVAELSADRHAPHEHLSGIELLGQLASPRIFIRRFELKSKLTTRNSTELSEESILWAATTQASIDPDSMELLGENQAFLSWMFPVELLVVAGILKVETRMGNCIYSTKGSCGLLSR